MGRVDIFRYPSADEKQFGCNLTVLRTRKYLLLTVKQTRVMNIENSAMLTGSSYEPVW
jgi:hypothetical protein